ncbi:MAG: hypothetical protein V4509_05020 [Patescibacteria group bacterium]
MKEIILTVSLVCYFVSFVPYIKGILNNSVKPRPLSWLGWSMLLIIGLASQIIEYGFNSSMLIVISAGFGCFLIFIISLFKRAKMDKEYDYMCFASGIICMVIYLATKDAFITTLFAICADFFVGVPTILNVYKNPRSENLLAWGLGSLGILLSYTVVLGEKGYLLKLYPTYMLFFNLLIFLLCFRRFNAINKTHNN